MESQFPVLGALGALVMGASLGLFGAGGSILTVPILVYLFLYPPVLAAHYSLFVVGCVSAFGVFWQWREDNIHWAKIIGFAIPALFGMFVIKRLIIPALPQTIPLFAFSITLNQFILAVFAILMIAASLSMIFLPALNQSDSPETSPPNLPLLALVGASIGLITGFVGAGGGFLIVPSLIFLARLSVKEATRASLFLISINSIFGFAAGTTNWPSVPFRSLLLLVAIALIGIVSGLWIQKRTAASKLKPAFGLFILATGFYILLTARSG